MKPEKQYDQHGRELQGYVVNYSGRKAAAMGCQIIIMGVIIGLIIILIWLGIRADKRQKALEAQRQANQQETAIEAIGPKQDEDGVYIYEKYCPDCSYDQLAEYLKTVSIQNLDEVENVAGRILKQNTEANYARAKMISAYKEKGMNDEALTQFETILSYDPKNLSIRQQMLAFYCELDRVSDAEAFYQESIQVINPPGALLQSASCVENKAPLLGDVDHS